MAVWAIAQRFLAFAQRAPRRSAIFLNVVATL